MNSNKIIKITGVLLSQQQYKAIEKMIDIKWDMKPIVEKEKVILLNGFLPVVSIRLAKAYFQ